MSRRLYCQTAAVIRRALQESYSCAYAAAASDIAKGIADAFKEDDPAFRYDMFFTAAGLDNWREPLPNPLHPNAIGER
jgi:hypothetical protein